MGDILLQNLLASSSPGEWGIFNRTLEDEKRASLFLRRFGDPARLGQGEESKVRDGESGGRNWTVRWPVEQEWMGRSAIEVE